MRYQLVFITLEGELVAIVVNNEHRRELLLFERACVRCDFVDDVDRAEGLVVQVVDHRLLHFVQHHVVKYKQAFGLLSRYFESQLGTQNVRCV